MRYFLLYMQDETPFKNALKINRKLPVI